MSVGFLNLGGTEMLRNAIVMMLAVIFTAGASVGFACEYKKGETKYADYAACVHGKDAILVVDLPEDFHSWDQCVYLAEAWKPPKLLAITKDNGGTEQVSVSDRSQIGNPCYLAKQACDKAYKALQN